MNKLTLYVLLAACFSLLFLGCSKKNSDEACQHETTMNLDSGNYDAVLASGCADAMQKGAAWFGKAGFDIANVINRFSETGKSNNNGGTSTATSDLTVYVTALIGNVDENTLTFIDNSRTEYDKVPATADIYKDARFYVSLADMLKGLALIKISIPNLVNADGTLNMTCDKNNNKVPDEADATACEMIAASNISLATTLTCTGASYSPSSPIDITLTDPAGQPVAGTYSGLLISIATSTTDPTPACAIASYKRLLYKDAAGKYWAATTKSTLCTGSDAQQWPCPLTGPNLDLVASIDTSINNSVSSLSSAVTTTTSDVQTSINTIQTQACKTPCSSVCPGSACPQSCLAGATLYCSSSDLSSYIETNLK
jgi:hypothetical protein